MNLKIIVHAQFAIKPTQYSSNQLTQTAKHWLWFYGQRMYKTGVEFFSCNGIVFFFLNMTAIQFIFHVTNT